MTFTIDFISVFLWGMAGFGAIAVIAGVRVSFLSDLPPSLFIAGAAAMGFWICVAGLVVTAVIITLGGYFS